MTVVVEAHKLDNRPYDETFELGRSFIDDDLPNRMKDPGPARQGSHAQVCISDGSWAYHVGKTVLAHRFFGAGFDCAAAMFAAAVVPADEDIEFMFDGRLLTGPGGTPNYAANEGLWVNSFLLGVALGRGEQLAAHLAYPTNRLRETAGEGDEFRYAMVDALKAFWTGNDTWKQLSVQALAESEADRLTVMPPRMAAPLRAVLEALTPIAEGDQVGFTAALVATLKAHKAYHGRGRPSRSCLSVVSIPACGVAALGLQRGLRVEVESGYMPTWLVTGP